LLTFNIQYILSDHEKNDKTGRKLCQVRFLILDDMRDVMRRHYSIRTERSYCGWVKRFVLHFNMKSRDEQFLYGSIMATGLA